MKIEKILPIILVALLFLLLMVLNVEKPSTQSVIYIENGEEKMIEDPNNLAFAITSQSISCTPDQPYTSCTAFKKFDDEVYFGGEVLSAKVEAYSNVFMPPFNQNTIRYYTGAKAGKISPYTNGYTRLYYTDQCFNTWTEFWNYADCVYIGCKGMTKVDAEHEITLTNGYGDTYTGCPTYVALTNYSLAQEIEYVGAAYYGKGMGNKTTIINPDLMVECNAGETDCEGEQFLECQNNEFVNQGLVDGECGYFAPECNVGEQTCIGDTLKYCSNGSWDYETNSSECIEIICSIGETKCEGTTLLTCNNNTWDKTPYSPECGYVPPETCTTGDIRCLEGSTLICKNNEWENAGVIEGYCGAEKDPMEIIILSIIDNAFIIIGVLTLSIISIIGSFIFLSKGGKKK